MKRRAMSAWRGIQRGCVEPGQHIRPSANTDHAAAGAELRRSRRLVPVPPTDTEVAQQALSEWVRSHCRVQVTEMRFAWDIIKHVGH